MQYQPSSLVRQQLLSNSSLTSQSLPTSQPMMVSPQLLMVDGKSTKKQNNNFCNTGYSYDENNQKCAGNLLPYTFDKQSKVDAK